MNLANAFGSDGDATPEAPAINPLLDGNVRPGFHLQVAFSGIPTVVVPERSLDVPGGAYRALQSGWSSNSSSSERGLQAK